MEQLLDTVHSQLRELREKNLNLLAEMQAKVGAAATPTVASEVMSAALQQIKVELEDRMEKLGTALLTIRSLPLVMDTEQCVRYGGC